jgi:hypothetical protein
MKQTKQKPAGAEVPLPYAGANVESDKSIGAGTRLRVHGGTKETGMRMDGDKQDNGHSAAMATPIRQAAALFAFFIVLSLALGTALHVLQNAPIAQAMAAPMEANATQSCANDSNGPGDGDAAPAARPRSQPPATD